MFDQSFFDYILQNDFETDMLISKIVSVKRITSSSVNTLGELAGSYREICKINAFIEPIQDDNRNIPQGVTQMQRWRMFCDIGETIYVEDTITDLSTGDEYIVETVAKKLNHIESILRKI